MEFLRNLRHVSPYSLHNGKYYYPKTNELVFVILIVLAVLVCLMNLQAFAWWRRAKHSTCWIPFMAVVNILIVSGLIPSNLTDPGSHSDLLLHRHDHFLLHRADVLNHERTSFSDHSSIQRA
jgi:hypothetical protein